jgi:protein NUD1
LPLEIACLRHLRELKADGNKISSIDGLQRMTALIKLSLQGNNLRGELDISQFKWQAPFYIRIMMNELSDRMN